MPSCNWGDYIEVAKAFHGIGTSGDRSSGNVNFVIFVDTFRPLIVAMSLKVIRKYVNYGIKLSSPLLATADVEKDLDKKIGKHETVRH